MTRLRSKPRFIVLTLFAVSMIGAFLLGAGFSGGETPVVGTFTVVDKHSGYVIAAPHAEFDTFTGPIARGVCQRVGWSCLLASGFETEGPRINVNRPTEGVRLGETAFSDRAARVYSAYMTKLRALSPRLKLYVEIHGNNHPDMKDNVEIATAGVSEAWAVAIRNELTRAFATHGLPQASVHLDVLEDIRYAATHNREFGALSTIQPALHMELPQDMREQHREAIVKALADALPRIAEHSETPPQFASR